MKLFIILVSSLFLINNNLRLLDLTKNLFIDQKRKITEKTYTLNDVKITLNQIKSDGKEFYCKVKIATFKKDNLIDSLSFNPEPVGGNYGVSKAMKIKNHLIINKFGDYDGRTIIINDKGKIFNVMGGDNYYDSSNGLLFNIYDSDLPGLTVFDLKDDSLLCEFPEIEDYPKSIHKTKDNKYYALCSNANSEDNSTWEIDLTEKRMKQVDLNEGYLNKKSILKTWDLGIVDCECKK